MALATLTYAKPRLIIHLFRPLNVTAMKFTN